MNTNDAIEILENYIRRINGDKEIGKINPEIMEDAINTLISKVKNLSLSDVSNNEVVAVPSDGVSVAGCPYRVQNSCNFKGTFCLDETCNIRAKLVTDC